jgi:hypothetical protein
MYTVMQNSSNVWYVTNVTTQERPVTKLPKLPYVPSIDRDVLSACQLTWWRIRGYTNDYDDNGRLVRSVDGSYEKKGWLGLTVNNYSALEVVGIKKWVKAKGREAVYMSRQDRIDDNGEMWVCHFIGDYAHSCYNFWFSTQDLLDEFIAFLKAFPKRDAVFVIKNLSGAMQFIKGINYMVLRGERAVALAVPRESMDTTDFILMRLGGA